MRFRSGLGFGVVAVLVSGLVGVAPAWATTQDELKFEIDLSFYSEGGSNSVLELYLTGPDATNTVTVS